jgi:hypothetical protein
MKMHSERITINTSLHLGDSLQACWNEAEIPLAGLQGFSINESIHFNILKVIFSWTSTHFKIYPGMKCRFALNI